MAEAKRKDEGSRKELVSHLGAQVCSMPRFVSAQTPLLRRPASSCFALQFPPHFSAALGENEESRSASVG